MKEVIKMTCSVVPSLGMFSRYHFPAFCGRLASTQIPSAVAKLRKSTGFTLSNCVEALKLHSLDIEKAEQWLYSEGLKQGWPRFRNLRTHATTPGVVGICTQNSSAAMVEVNCETDSIACSAEFHAFVGKILGACVNHAVSQTFKQDFTKMRLSSEELNSLKFENSSLADLVATACGKFGEKTILKQATCIRAKGDIILSSYVHQATTLPDLSGVEIGKYGALLAYQQKISTSQPVDQQMLLDLGSKLCRHIINMQPYSLGEFTVKDLNALQKKGQEREVADSDANVKLSPSGEEKGSVGIEDDSQFSDEKEKITVFDLERLKFKEGRFLHQPFIFDPSKVVGEVLAPLSVEVIGFERFHCGDYVFI